MSIPIGIGAAGMFFSPLVEIRNAARNLSVLTDDLGLDDTTATLSSGILKRVEADQPLDKHGLADIEALFIKLKKHLESIDPELAKIVVGNLSSSGTVVERIAKTEKTEGMESEKRRSGAGATALVQMQLSASAEVKRSGQGGDMVKNIRETIKQEAIADIDLDKAQQVLDEIKANLVDGIQDMDEIHELKKLMGSVPGLFALFPSLLDDLKAAVTEFLVAEINTMGADDAKAFAKEVVAVLSEAAGSDVLSDDEIDTLVEAAVQPMADLAPIEEEDAQKAPTISVTDIRSPEEKRLKQGLANVAPVAINPNFMQGFVTTLEVKEKQHIDKTTTHHGGEQGQKDKEGIERVRDILSAVERLYYEKLNDEGNFLNKVLNKLG